MVTGKQERHRLREPGLRLSCRVLSITLLLVMATPFAVGKKSASVELRCSAKGADTNEIFWYVNGKLIGKGRTVQTTIDGTKDNEVVAWPLGYRPWSDTLHPNEMNPRYWEPVFQKSQKDATLPAPPDSLPKDWIKWLAGGSPDPPSPPPSSMPPKPTAFVPTPGPSQVPSAEAAVAVPGVRWAVVVGVGKQKDTRIPQLQYAAPDARLFADWLKDPGGGGLSEDHIKVLLDEEATGVNMKAALFDWAAQAIAEDMLIIYFAGHGSPASPDSPENLFLLPYDANYDQIASTGFPMWDIQTALQRFVKARKVVVLADACHAGGVGVEFAQTRRGIGGVSNPVSAGFQDLTKVGDGVAVITASDSNQLSREGEDWGGGHGVFTWFMVEGLKGKADIDKNGKVSMGELIPFISEAVRRETRSAQSPTVAGKFDPALQLGG